jgi:hypothetical protein
MASAREEWIEYAEDFPEELLICDSKYTYLQSAYQVNYQNGIIKMYKKLVIRVNMPTDFSKVNPLSVAIGDSNEEWVLHSVKINRAGRVIDKTETITFSELQRETGLEENVLTGTKTYVAHIDDLKIGDIISYDYTVISSDPIHANHFEYFLSTTYTVPLYHIRLKVQYNNSMNQCAYRIYDGFQEKERGFIDESGVFVYERHDIDAVVFEENIPNHRSPFAHIELSDYKDWSDFGMAVGGYYQSSDDTTDFIQNYAQSIVQECQNKQQALEALVHHVQKNIGYLSLSLNEHSYIPHAPISVAQNNYGDCKDKTLLLKTLLKTQGIESTVVLVHTAYSKDTNNRLPSLSCFNHVIISIEFNGSEYLVDPTASYDCFSIEHCAEPWFESGVFLSDTPHLRVFDTKKNSVYLRKVVEHFTISGDSATLEVTDEYYYHAFPSVAHRQTTTSKENCKKTYLDYYAKRYPSISFNEKGGDGSEYAYSIDTHQHCLVITSKFVIPLLWEKSKNSDENVYRVGFFPGDLLEIVRSLPGTARKYPFLWLHQAECRVRFIVDYDFDATMGSLDKKIDNNLFSYTVTTTDKKQTYIYDTHYKSKSDVIEAADYAKMQKVVYEFIDNLGFVITRPENEQRSDTYVEKDRMSTWTKVGIAFGIMALLRLIAGL